MKKWIIEALLVVTVVALAGCGGAEATPAAEESVGETYTSEVLDTSYDGALSASNQLALGTLELEETDNAVTPEQAKSLLPLWQALQGGVTAQAEVNAVLKQIEGTMASEQLQAIARLQLTGEDLQAWMEEHGVGPGPGGFPGPGEGMSDEEREALRATRQAEAGGEGMPPGGGEGGPFGGGPGGGEMPPEMATRRAEFEGMSEEEREAARATMQASGGFPGGPGGGGGAGGGGQFPILLNPLIELLEARAGEA